MIGTYLSTVNIKRTRKPHECVWCGETIKAGSAAEKVTGVDCDGLGSSYYHPECSQACQRFYTETTQMNRFAQADSNAEQWRNDKP